MSNTLLALSHKAELGLHARVVADLQATAEPLGVAILIAGAFARDLHLHHAWGVPVQRQTGDVDFALAVNDWAAFELLRGQLINTGRFFEALGLIFGTVQNKFQDPAKLRRVIATTCPRQQ